VYHRGDYYLWAARVYASENRFDRAVGELERLAKKAHQYPELAGLVAGSSLLEGDTRARWAQHLLDEGKRDEAREQVERAGEAYASHAHLSPPWYNLGVLYFRLDEPAKAKTYLDRFLALEPEGPRADQVRRLHLRLNH
jgi:tetratricopeptide (TPR) repeat protein